MFGMDYRSLALLRFGLGLTMFGDLWDRSSDLGAHYTDLGAPLPIGVLPLLTWHRRLPP